MLSAEASEAPAAGDVCLVLEGTYPYVQGGVSSWVHDLIRELPDLRFSLVHVGPEPGACDQRRYELPANVTGLTDLYCRDPVAREHEAMALRRAARAVRRRHATVRQPSRMARAIRRLHLDERVDVSVLEDLASGDMSESAFLHGHEAFELITDLYERLAPGTRFLDFFWHARSMHLPLVRLLATPPPPAATYHALCTGYAGLLGAVWSHRAQRPFLLTEHGIYTRERSMELERANWFLRRRLGPRADRAAESTDRATVSALRRMWTHYFHALARFAYAQATRVVSLSGASQQKQVVDGAAAGRTLVIPNGIDFEAFRARVENRRREWAMHDTVRVGFVGRLVPIKDAVTFIHACSLALRSVSLDVRIIGPMDEDPLYAQRCRQLVSKLGLEHAVRFTGAMPAEQVYADLDVLVLTSFSEGQPLVVLEASAVGIPIVASDVGACRELLEGASEADRQLGPSGIVTRLASPHETAAAITRLAHDPELRRRMGQAGQRRVATYYRKRATVETYRALYAA